MSKKQVAMTDRDRIRWIEEHHPLIEWHYKIHGDPNGFGWIVALEYGATAHPDFRVAIDRAMREIPLTETEMMEREKADD